MARSCRPSATCTWLYFNPITRELRPTGEVSLHQCRAVGVATALPGGHDDRGVPEGQSEDAFHRVPGPVPGYLRISQVTLPDTFLSTSHRCRGAIYKPGGTTMGKFTG